MKNFKRVPSATNLQLRLHAKRLELRVVLDAPLCLSTNRRSYTLSECQRLPLSVSTLNFALGYVPSHSEQMAFLAAPGPDSLDEVDALFAEQLTIPRDEVLSEMLGKSGAARGIKWKCAGSNSKRGIYLDFTLGNLASRDSDLNVTKQSKIIASTFGPVPVIKCRSGAKLLLSLSLHHPAREIFNWDEARQSISEWSVSEHTAITTPTVASRKDSRLSMK